jgi:hypothetical protein
MLDVGSLAVPSTTGRRGLLGVAAGYLLPTAAWRAGHERQAVPRR